MQCKKCGSVDKYTRPNLEVLMCGICGSCLTNKFPIKWEYGKTQHQIDNPIFTAVKSKSSIEFTAVRSKQNA